jgi:uracil-DNA glycosylase family 4
MALELDTRQRAMLQEMGVRVWLPDAPVSLDPVAAEAKPVVAAEVNVAQRSAPAPATPVVAVVPPAQAAVRRPPLPVAAPALSGQEPAVQSLDGQALAAAAAACQACGLCAGRRQSTAQAVVTQADWMVVGDPPDEDEDRLGQPFAEQAGVLLDAMLKSVGARRGGAARQGAYLSNVVKCRPPNARLPQPAELQQCEHYLRREVELVQPKVILAMGRWAAQVLLQEHPEQASLPLGKQRGMVYHYRGIPVVVSYHPKVLLRASADKAKAWADLCLALDVLDAAS